MKIIRAERGIYVPHDPENPDNNSMRAVHAGLIALVPDNFSLPKDYFQDLGRVEVKRLKKDKDSKE